MQASSARVSRRLAGVRVALRGCSRRVLTALAWQDSGGRGAQAPSPIVGAAVDTILQRYLGQSPTADAVVQRVIRDKGEPSIPHDHLAFRTFGTKGLGIESLGGALEQFGFTKQEYYAFPRKQLLATWYAPPGGDYEGLPRIFVSELQVEKLSAQAQRIVASYTSPISDDFSPIAAWTSAVTGVLPWARPAYEDYQALLEESEYAAWVLVNGYGLNHTALSVHRLTSHSGDLYAFADTLVRAGFTLNDEGGIMKVSPDSGLLQCSTVADVNDFRFADGQVHPVAAAYLEFVERKPLPQHEQLPPTQLTERHRRDGFEAASADKIFHSTTLAASGLKQRGST